LEDGKIETLSKKVNTERNSFKEFASMLTAANIDDKIRVFGKKFIKQYLAAASTVNQLPKDLSLAFADILSIYAGDNDEMMANLLTCITPATYLMVKR